MRLQMFMFTVLQSLLQNTVNRTVTKVANLYKCQDWIYLTIYLTIPVYLLVTLQRPTVH